MHLDETPLENIDEAVPDTELLAPYYDPITIKYAVATVMPLSVTKKQEGKIINVGSIFFPIDVHAYSVFSMSRIHAPICKRF